MAMINLKNVAAALEKNGFKASVAYNANAAVEMVLDMLERENPKTVAAGSSQTLRNTGIYNLLRNSSGIQFVDTGANTGAMYEAPGAEALKKLKEVGLNSDMFFCSANAVVEDGRLVNLDFAGNRVSSFIFGPKRVVVVAGRNKIVPDLETAFARVKKIAPTIVKMLGVKPPCAKAGVCIDCDHPERICCTWVLSAHCWPKGRIHVILVDEELGL